MRLVHTPYDGSATPFTIGLRPLDPRRWIEIDDDLERYLAEKDRLFATVPDRVFMARQDTAAAQREVLDELVRYLPERFAETYKRDGDHIAVGATGRTVRLGLRDAAALKSASRLVPEDLVLMRKCADGWRLVAASLCFPSSWSLAEKFDRPLDIVHAPVPAFGPGTRAAALITRIFDSLKIDQPVERMNWSLQEDAALHHPRSKSERDARVEGSGETLLGARPADAAFIRVERQTLRKMPVSGDILFTIRIYLDPLDVLRRHPRRVALASSLADQLAALDPAQLSYKGITANRDGLIAVLRAIAAG